MKSIYHKLGTDIMMPNFIGRLLYMHRTKMDSVQLPNQFKDYQETINQILSMVPDKNNVCYITIDEKEVTNGTHRKGGIHVDFNWYEHVTSHNGGTRSTHLDNDPTEKGYHSTGQHKKSNGGHNSSPPSTHNNLKEYNINGGMLLVSNHVGCQVYKGNIIGEIGEKGCCKNIDISKMETEIMQPGEVYYLNALGVHEGIFIPGTVKRSLIRINFHPDYIFEPIK